MKLDEIREKAVPILKRARVRRAAVFGSAARGDMRGSSDIDLLVEVQRPYGLFTFLSIKADLEDALGRNVDLVEYAMLKESLRDRALKDAVKIV
jgi:predicted nucleotidyltransferase